MALYLSFAAHFPYFDYGRKYRIKPQYGRLIDRYYNNLNLLDHAIERIYKHLEGTGGLERTIIVIAGDHGQAFGQHHTNNYMHFRYSYSENLQSPAIIHQPELFKQRVIDFPTSHVDILPTLLDAMSIPYNRRLFQGESLYQNRLRRRYIFFFGQENTLSSLNSNQIKVQYSLRNNRCWAFDLMNDSDEKNLLPCDNYHQQLEALVTFASYQKKALIRYNKSVKEKTDFDGYRH